MKNFSLQCRILVATDRGQAYTYEPERDFLASASYTKPGWSNQTWEYGPTGNRTDGTYDQLDRIVTQGARRFKHDTLGNRTETDWQSSALFRATKWDALGRMRSYQGTEGGSVYRYRADGMRVSKVGANPIGVNLDDEGVVSGFYDVYTTTDKPTERYYYDGQTPVSEDFRIKESSGFDRIEETATVVGARGLERHR